MSVVQSKRGESDLTLITKANELATYTINICTNEKNFPKRYRWCITNKIVEFALDINNKINMANSVFVKDESDYLLRKGYQTEALASTYALLSSMDIAYRSFGIESDRMKHWTGKVINVQILLRNWRKSEIEKHG